MENPYHGICTIEDREKFQHMPGRYHPLTCANRHTPEHKEYQKANGHHDHGILMAAEDGWKCPVCDYHQPFSGIDPIVGAMIASFKKRSGDSVCTE